MSHSALQIIMNTLDIDETFNQLVEKLFSSWTAISLAKNHETGGPNTNEKIAYIQKNLLSHIKSFKDSSDLEMVLEDYLHEELNTVCEDDSLKEISNILYWALERYRAKDYSSILAKLNQVPNPCDTNTCVTQVTNDSDDLEESLDEESEGDDMET
ncbi:rRNA accumulation- protein [Cichlidogyrus casuarinus]|uniref:Pre-rRNA-processing protein TSR2 homolog n=1 Tax=Cichlidogyrus casuarinus TaxID=1844966 RepID=A0ABD2QKU7_9PLAT